MAGQVEVVMETTSPAGQSSCSIEFSGAPDLLAEFGLRSLCPPEASVILVFTPSADGLHLNEAASDEIDNGECLEAA